MEPDNTLALIAVITGSVGAATGIAALYWNIRSTLSADRLHVSFYVYSATEPTGVVVNGEKLALGPMKTRSAAHVRVSNIGTRAVHVSSIATTQDPGWSRRIVLFRSLSAHTRTKLHWVIGKGNFWAKSDAAISGKKLAQVIEPGQAATVEIDDETLIEKYVKEARWVVVETGIRTYVSRIEDNRGEVPDEPLEGVQSEAEREQ